jgi:hypothetical protein
MLSVSISSTSKLLSAPLPLAVDLELGLETGVPTGDKLSSGLAAVFTFGGVPTIIPGNKEHSSHIDSAH